MSLEQFLARFNTEEDCIEFLFQSKWPNGYVCPRCGHRHVYITTTRRLPLYECALCRRQTSLIVGTMMEGSRTELRKWLLTLFLVAHSANGINALELSRRIKVTYKTAWLMLHKIRSTMTEADTSILLSGFVRVNAVCYGRPHNPTIWRHPKEQPLLVAAQMNGQDEPTYVKIKIVPESHMREKQILRIGTDEFAKEHLELGTAVEFVTQRYTPNRLKQLLPLFAEANKWINETFHGLGPRYLQAYLNEFCYRFNLKRQAMQIFEKLTKICMACKTVTYANLIGKKGSPFKKLSKTT